MTNEEAIKEIGQMRVSLIETVFVEPKSVQKKDEALAMATIALRQNQWIPCSERLPEPGEYYLVTVQFLGWNGTEYREIDIAEYEYDGWDKANTVLAWCELPKPYEGRTE